MPSNVALSMIFSENRCSIFRIIPVAAIFEENDVPTSQLQFTALNAELAPQWPRISKTKKALDDADAWASVEHKTHLLER